MLLLCQNIGGCSASSCWQKIVSPLKWLFYPVCIYSRRWCRVTKVSATFSIKPPYRIVKWIVRYNETIQLQFREIIIAWTFFFRFNVVCAAYFFHRENSMSICDDNIHYRKEQYQESFILQFYIGRFNSLICRQSLVWWLLFRRWLVASRGFNNCDGLSQYFIIFRIVIKAGSGFHAQR